MSVSGNEKKYQSKNPFKRFFFRRFLHNIIKLVPVQKYNTVLDAGCGEGLFLEFLQKKALLNGVEVFGFDISSADLRKARERLPECNFFSDNIENIENKKKTELVFCLEVLEHLKEPEKALKELTYIADKVVISTPWEPIHSMGNLLSGKNIKRLGRDKEHMNFWNKKEITSIVFKYFEIEKVKISFPWTIILARKKTQL